jgi:hypothetical protein
MFVCDVGHRREATINCGAAMCDDGGIITSICSIGLFGCPHGVEPGPWVARSPCLVACMAYLDSKCLQDDIDALANDNIL